MRSAPGQIPRAEAADGTRERRTATRNPSEYRSSAVRYLETPNCLGSLRKHTEELWYTIERVSGPIFPEEWTPSLDTGLGQLGWGISATRTALRSWPRQMGCDVPCVKDRAPWLLYCGRKEACVSPWADHETTTYAKGTWHSTIPQEPRALAGVKPPNLHLETVPRD